jgi:hypothetical protein
LCALNTKAGIFRHRGSKKFQAADVEAKSKKGSRSCLFIRTDVICC